MTSGPTARDLFIAGFLLVQVALPLFWYLGGSDPADTRFAWRMFARQDAATCRGGFARDGVPVDLGRELGAAWVADVYDGRRVVIGRIGEHLCAAGGPVTLDLECLWAPDDSERIGDVTEDLCR
jgi:hypothetical protein